MDDTTKPTRRSLQGRSPPSGASPRSRRGLDWFVFFVADVQTGFGPFVAVYLTSQKWTQVDIGLILTIGGLISLFGQVPGGAILDAVRSPRLIAAVSVIAVGISAVMLALWPIFAIVLFSRILQASASCLLGPAIAAMSLGLVERREAGERFGRNAAFASVGTGLAAAGMGACGYYISNQAVFFVTGALVVPALLSLMWIKSDEINVARSHGGERSETGGTLAALAHVFGNPALLIFALCVMLFHLANAAILPLVAGLMTLRSSVSAPAFIAAAMVVPQFVVALLSPVVGRKARTWGRRPLLLIGFAALAARIGLFAYVTSPSMVVVVQVLDGLSAAVLGVLVPLSIADLTRNTGRFNLTQGAVGCAMGIGASISTTMAGYLTDRFSSSATFLVLGGIATLGLLAVWLLMPETRPPEETEDTQK